jgi:hypothetical protein
LRNGLIGFGFLHETVLPKNLLSRKRPIPLGNEIQRRKPPYFCKPEPLAGCRPGRIVEENSKEFV